LLAREGDPDSDLLLPCEGEGGDVVSGQWFFGRRETMIKLTLDEQVEPAAPHPHMIMTQSRDPRGWLTAAARFGQLVNNEQGLLLTSPPDGRAVKWYLSSLLPLYVLRWDLGAGAGRDGGSRSGDSKAAMG
jgi:hypothetical protein